MSELDLLVEYGYWDEHPAFPVETWQYEVTSGDTRRSYWQWVAVNLEASFEED